MLVKLNVESTKALVKRVDQILNHLVDLKVYYWVWSKLLRAYQLKIFIKQFALAKGGTIPKSI